MPTFYAELNSVTVLSRNRDVWEFSGSLLRTLGASTYKKPLV